MKAKLAKMGLAAFLSYGIVSNVTYGTALTVAWIGFVKAYRVCPLAEGQWPAFLAFYAGAWMMQNFVRPARFALAMAMAPWFDQALDCLSGTFGVKRHTAFVGCLVAMAITQMTLLFSAIYLLGGLPDGLGPFPPLKRF